MKSGSDNISQQLIFLISQPRAGSTLTQKILGNHPEIHTLSEPWLMLHPLYALRTQGYEAEYDASLSQRALVNFFKELPDRENSYFQAVRKMYSGLYQSALEGSGKSYFLDKTPRYYHIIPELYQTFPRSNFIILFRNPLSVLCSIYQTWVKDNWFLMRRFKWDLLKAPFLLLQGVKLLGSQCAVLHYEKVLQNPDRQFREIYHRLNLKFADDYLYYKNDTKWDFGDKKKVYGENKPDAENIEKWILCLKNPQIWRLANDYLYFLDRDIIEAMGYSWENLNETLETHRPSKFAYWKTFSLELMLKEIPDYQKIEYENLLVKLASKFQLSDKLIQDKFRDLKKKILKL